MNFPFVRMQPSEDYYKWYKWAYRQRYRQEEGKRSLNAQTFKQTRSFPGFSEFKDPFKTYWSEEHKVGILERKGKFIGVACLAAKEVVDKESFVKKFGLSFKGDVHWKAAPVLLDHLARSPVFKAVFVSLGKVPFKLQPDIPEDLAGKLRWAERNFEFHKRKAETLKLAIKAQEKSLTPGGPFPRYLPKQMKEEQDHARKFLDSVKSLESLIQEHLRQYFLIKENLIAVALLFYIYTSPHDSFTEALNEILSRRRSAKIEANLTYFVKCVDVADPLIVFHPEFFPLWDEVIKYYGIALTRDTAGFDCDKDVASVFRKFFTSALELPKEERIEEKIHVPSEEVSIPLPRTAFIGYVVESVIERKVTRRKVYFPLDILTSHAIIFGKTRIGKSFLALILIQEALANGIRVVVFDPHGTIAKRIGEDPLLEVNFTRGRSDITGHLKKIYDEVSVWPETNRLKLFVVLDETRLLKAKNLAYCINELGKRGVGFLLITQYSTSIPSEVRNVGTYFIMGAMSEREIQRFKEVTLHASSRLISRLPKAMSFVYSPFWHPEPFFVRHKKIVQP